MRLSLNLQKSLALLLVAIVFSVAPAMCKSSHAGAEAKKERSLAAPFPIAGKTSRLIQKYTGVTFISQLVASQVTRMAVKKRMGGKVKAKVRLFSLTDLLAGKIESAEVRVRKGKIKGTRMGEMAFVTKKPLWYGHSLSPFNKRKPGMKNDLAIAVTGRVSQDDVTCALKSERVVSCMRGLKLDLPGLGNQQLEVLEPDVRIEQGLLKIDAILVTKGADRETGVPIKMSGRPYLLDGEKIMVGDLKVESPYIVEPEKFAEFVMTLINPVVRFGRYDRHTHAFRLRCLEIGDDSVSGEGELVIFGPKKVASKGKS